LVENPTEMVNMFRRSEKSSADVIGQRLNGTECSRMSIDPILYHGARRVGRGYWILDANRNPVKVRVVVDWAHWVNEDKRRVASTAIGDVHVSTHRHASDR
jgi:hypothetical protein